MATLKHSLLVLVLVPLVLGLPYHPPTCYTKVLNMAREIAQRAAELKSNPENRTCLRHIPDLYMDIHNECVMSKMRTYVSQLEAPRVRRCSYTLEVRKLALTVRQLFIIMSQKCHGDLVFTKNDCGALEHAQLAYATTTAPLRELLKKDATWTWTHACSASLRQLKAQLTSLPMLAHFDLASPTILTCDASSTVVGAVLSQLQQGTERPVAFASRSLTSAEQKYSVGEREPLACVWVCEQWHMYVHGRHFTL
ncbi:CYTL1 domain-containing protein [Lampris incognitus]|uniref:CYTL1 domain-containing protein n=1 Tax=Lampris incognitus TaxID=2546036 RepID=UPI0024B5E05D|nr:CYTL1 domain-containing protein [Lampris incognitus]